MDQGHWIGQVADPEKFFGFIYLIEDNTSGKAYLGRKQYWRAKPKATGCKSRVADKSSSRWKEDCWIESDWRDYKGSSKNLKEWMSLYPNNEYIFTILKQCYTKGGLTYNECKYLWKYEVLEDKLEDGSYRYFNAQIGAVKFRPKEI